MSPISAFGLDAHSMVRTHQGRAQRFCNSAVLADYVADTEPEPPPEPLTQSDELEEAWFLGLRLNDGVAWQTLIEEFGSEPVAAFPPGCA